MIANPRGWHLTSRFSAAGEVRSGVEVLSEPLTRGPQPDFQGMVRAELRKLVRQRATWAMAAGSTVGIGAVIILYATQVNLKTMLEQSSHLFIRQTAAVVVEALASVIGTFLLVGAARLVAMEYSQGTIRVLAARGVGRFTFLAAKLVALAVAGLLLTAAGLVICAVAIAILTTFSIGSAAWLSSANLSDWHAVAVGVGTLGASLLVCVLLPTAVAVVSRSTAFAVSAALIFFPASTIAAGLIRSTGQPLVATMTDYLLGSNLNALPGAALEIKASLADTPADSVNVPHILGVVAAWCAFFLAASVIMLRRRDIKE